MNLSMALEWDVPKWKIRACLLLLLLFDGNHDVGAKYALTLPMTHLC